MLLFYLIMLPLLSLLFSSWFLLMVQSLFFRLVEFNMPIKKDIKDKTFMVRFGETTLMFRPKLCPLQSRSPLLHQVPITQ
jgi:hypothetical protein